MEICGIRWFQELANGAVSKDEIRKLLEEHSAGATSPRRFEVDSSSITAD